MPNFVFSQKSRQLERLSRKIQRSIRQVSVFEDMFAVSFDHVAMRIDIVRIDGVVVGSITFFSESVLYVYIDNSDLDSPIFITASDRRLVDHVIWQFI